MKINAQKRELTGKQVKTLRKNGVVPASIYGPNRTPVSVSVDEKEFAKIFKEVSYNKFFDVELEGEGKFKVLVKDFQRHPVTFKAVSVSFYQVAEDRKLTVQVPVRQIGESPAVKQNLGFLIVQFDAIEVHCLPKDLPGEFVIDLSKLETPLDTILVSSIQLPEGVEWDSSIDVNSAIAYIGTSQKEEALEAKLDTQGAQAEVAATETPEGGETPTEGATPAAATDAAKAPAKPTTGKPGK
jgi:large subunit ribosomal protein L25